MTWLIGFLFVMGMVWGSFLNVVILRSVKKKSFVSGRSICPKCKKQLAWYHNIPLISYFALGGKCAFCKKKISILYPVVEFLTGVFFVWWFLVGFGFFRLVGSPWSIFQPLFWLVVGLVFIVIFVVDLLYMVIPFWLNMFLLTWVLFYKISLVLAGNMQSADFGLALFCGVCLTLFFWSVNKLTLYLKGVAGFGMGDVFLAPSLGLILGWPKILPAIFASFVLGAIVGVLSLLTKKKTIQDYLPFGPFLIVGCVIGLVYGGAIWEWYMSVLV